MNEEIKGKTNYYYERLESLRQDYSFVILESEFQKRLGIESLDNNLLKVLMIMDDNGKITNVGALFADNNDYKGIEITKYDNSNQIIKRFSFDNMSVLKMYYKALEVFDNYYEDITISKEAFRRAIIIALVHKAWDIDRPIKVEMFDEYIEVVSNGDYIRGDLVFKSGDYFLPRNYIVSTIFNYFDFMERVEVGLRAINSLCENCLIKPKYQVIDSALVIKLYSFSYKPKLTPSEEKIHALFRDHYIYTSSYLEDISGYSKSQVTRILKSLIAKDLIIKEGNYKSAGYLKA